jgi:ferredoxin
MADPKLRLAQNAPGKFFVDASCIGCDVCVNEGPDFFTLLSGTPLTARPTSDPRVVEADADDVRAAMGKAVVSRQPRTPAEVDAMREILSLCPTNSIGEEL